jgi:hypothetical protein
MESSDKIKICSSLSNHKTAEKSALWVPQILLEPAESRSVYNVSEAELGQHSEKLPGYYTICKQSSEELLILVIPAIQIKIQIFSLLSLFLKKNKRRFMRCLAVCVSVYPP